MNGFINWMEAVLKFLNANSGGLTFVITFVYVVATIAICVANIQSANASKKQLREMQKQYADENRPRIEVEFLYERRAFYGLRFINHGKETAQNVEIRLSDEFIDSLGNTNFSELLKKQKGKKCVIGVDQHYDLFFANEDYLQILDKIPASGTILYEDRSTKYQSDFNIDTENYATIFSFESDEEKLLKAMKEQTTQLKSIKEGIRAIARNTNQFNDTEESE
jgi:hypothetical protein